MDFAFAQENTPMWAYQIPFNYAFKSTDRIAAGGGSYTVIKNYELYNKRRRLVAQLQLTYSPDESAPAQKGQLTVHAWSWDSDPNMQEHRLGLQRPGEYRFADRAAAVTVLKLAESGVDRLLYVTGATDSCRYFDNRGRLEYEQELTRASEVAANGFILGLQAEAEARLVTEGNYNFASDTSIHNVYPFLPQTITDMRVTRFQELTPDTHSTVSVLIASPGNKVSHVSRVIHSPIPTQARETSLEVGKWLPTDLSESPVAACARYYDYIFNNSYYNLNVPDDVGLQQIISAADADFVYKWEKTNEYAFNDLRSLRAGLFGYFQVMAVMLCRQLKIRFTYVNYVASIIAMLETRRGITSGFATTAPFTNTGIHGYYPFIRSIEAAYGDSALQQIFSFLRVDLGSNDSTDALLGFYLEHIPAYNRFMAGETTEAGQEISALGTAIAADIKTYLERQFEFQLRFLWSDIDRALTAAFNNDRAHTGSLELNDPALLPSPGDTISVELMDEPPIYVKAMAVSLAVSPTTISANVEIKKPII